ncbi:MAG TPA: YeaH/YhbH family protein [Azospirillaceae bacterium]|nr:YeaH/YhbH family protein [Azospirillaceae bacterium]
MNVVDRRRNPQGKSLANRQRFLRRAKEQVRQAVSEAVAKRKVSDINSPTEKVTVRTKGVGEPMFHLGTDGDREYVLPGNKQYTTGDRIPRPPGGEGGRGGEASDQGGGEDEFLFTLTREEFLDFFFEDLELPDLERKALAEVKASQPVRAGYSVSGTPSSLNVVRTMRNSLARRIALDRPHRDEIEALRAELDAANEAAADPDRITEIRMRLEEVVRRSRAVPFIDPVDVRYNRFERVPKPQTRAAMFCLMDVSGSMSEYRKDLAKRFFMLLHLFLETRYEHVDVIFIRHTEVAQEVDEDTFFRSRETGGTVVSTALEEMQRVQRERYPLGDWNIYIAQASDGDNFGNDSQHCVSLLEGEILPMAQYYAYIEVREVSEGLRASFDSDLWRHYVMVAERNTNFAMRKVTSPPEIYGVFRDLFAKRGVRTA